MLLVGDPILPGVERQSENSSLHLHPGENERSHHRDQLQTVCAAGGRRGTDLSTQQHPGGGECNLNPTSSLFVRPAIRHIQYNGTKLCFSGAGCKNMEHLKTVIIETFKKCKQGTELKILQIHNISYNK